MEEARTKAAKLIETAEAQGKEKFDALIAEGQKISDEQYALSLDQTKQKCAAMIEKAKVNEQKAIKMIAERIVRDSVNN